MVPKNPDRNPMSGANQLQLQAPCCRAVGGFQEQHKKTASGFGGFRPATNRWRLAIYRRQVRVTGGGEGAGSQGEKKDQRKERLRQDSVATTHHNLASLPP